VTLAPDQPALDALRDLPAGFSPVVDDERFVGTVSDRSIRLALLGSDAWPSLTVADVLDAEPLAVAPSASDDEVRALLDGTHVRACAVVDGDRLVGTRTVADVDAPLPSITAVVMAGGKGTRLQPLTDKVPKPLLALGRNSILERLLENFHEALIDDVWLAVNYMADVVEERIGDGTGYGVQVRYLREEQPLHTAGALGLLPERPAGPILVTHADQVTSLPFARMVDFHLAEDAGITVGAFYHEVQVPYGVLRHDGVALRDVDEKPTLRFPCFAGFTVLDPSTLDLVPPDTVFTMPDLMEAAKADGRRVVVFPIVETWLDIGNWDDLNKALLWFVTGEEGLL
jgi:dTDP-glucose pyrophosphorylase